jgi:hypothetical protein
LKGKLIALPPEKWKYSDYRNGKMGHDSFSTNLENFTIELTRQSEHINPWSMFEEIYEDRYRMRVSNGEGFSMRINDDKMKDVENLYRNIKNKVEPYYEAKEREASKKQMEKGLKDLEKLL